MIDVDLSVRNIRRSIDIIDSSLKEKDEAREKIIKIGRDVIRESGFVITFLHAGKIEEAEEHLRFMQEKFNEVTSLCTNYPELRNSGLVYNIVSEYVEAVLFHSILTLGYLPTLKELEVDPVPYLQGLLDLVGELKRRILDMLRHDMYEHALTLFNIAEAIYENARTLDYPDPILPGIRRKTDVARSVVESLRTLLTDLESRRKLMDSLKRCEGG